MYIFVMYKKNLIPQNTFMRKIFLLLCLAWLLPLFLLGQDFNNYKKVKAQGQIPQKFTTSSTDKYLADVKKDKESKMKRKERKLKQYYHMQTNFLVDELLLSGKILYNDPLSLYVNRVMDELLKNEPELRKQIEVYVIKSPAVNAFATNNGIIVVNMGLLAKLHNEAELAFVLAHEVIHFREEHNINQYVENENINKGKGIYRKTSLEDKLLARSNYSQESETEADMEGLKLFLESDYDINSIKGVFDVLDHAHTPFDEVVFKKSFLENPNLVIPQGYFLPKTAPVVTADELTKQIFDAYKEKNKKPVRKRKLSKEEKEKEEEAKKEREKQEEIELHKYSTHPAIKERRKAINKELEDEKAKTRQTYIVGEAEFLKIRKIARYENSYLYLQNREYEQALYNTYLLMQDNPKSVYLRKCLVKSLYGLAKYASTTRFDEIHTSPDYIVGHSQQVHHLVEKISASELTVLAMAHAWQLKKDVPEDDEADALVKDLFTELVDNYYPRRSFFSTTPRAASGNAATAATVNADGSVAPENDTLPPPKKKFGKKRKQQAKKKKTKFNKSSDMNQYAFAEMLQDPEFVKMYDDETKAAKLRKKESRKTKSYTYKREQELLASQNMANGDALGLEKVVFINPMYFKVNLTKRKSLRYLESEAAQKRLNAKIKENATMAGLDFNIVDKKELAALGTQGYNENSVLNAFIDEMADHGDIHFVNYMDEDMQALTHKYGTSNFIWTGFVSVKQKKSGMLLKLAAAAVYPLFIPIVAYDVITPDYDTYFYSIVIDVKTGKKLKTTFFNLGIKDRNDVLDGTLYDLYSQYKNKREKPQNEKAKK